MDAHDMDVDARRDRFKAVRERLKAEIRDLEKNRDAAMLAYLLEMAKLECDDIIGRAGRHAQGR